jgi:hypothetical protein
MSQAPAAKNSDSIAEQFAKDAVLLLKEYTRTLNEITQRAWNLLDSAAELKGARSDDPRRLRLQSQHQSCLQVFQRINAAAHNLARVVSQRIEHGKFDDLRQAELRLRLAEFEASLQAAQMAVSNGLPGF